MRLGLDLDLKGLAAALAPQLGGLELEEVEARDGFLRIRARHPAAAFGLRARLRTRPGLLLLDRFEIEAGMLQRALIGRLLRERISRLDLRQGPLRIWGEAGGEALRVAWPAPDQPSA